MAIHFKDAMVWQKTVSALSTFISEGNFRFNDTGISFKAIDPSQVVLVNCFADKKAFEKFELEPTFVGIDLVEFSKIMSRASPSDKMEMDLSDSELSIKFDGELTRSFKLPLIEVGEMTVNIPDVKFDARIEMNSRLLKEALKDAALFGSSVVLKLKNKQLTIEARGSQGALRTVSKENKSVSIEGNSELTAKYSLNFLSNIVKEADPDKNLVLELKGDAPMKISYKIGNIELQFHLAHMIL